jgi:hypothetical protein
MVPARLEPPHAALAALAGATISCFNRRSSLY